MDEQGKRKYQLRELCETLLLLEGHLTNFVKNRDEVICCDCGKKHAMVLSAVAKESIGMLPELAPTLRRLTVWADTQFETFEVCHLEEGLADRLVGEARGFRLEFMRALEGMAAPRTAQPAASDAVAGAASSPHLQEAGPPPSMLHAHGYNPSLLEGEDDLVIHAIPDALCMGGIVIDRDRARRHPCLRFRADGGEIVFAKGVVGALTKEEQDDLCVHGYIEGAGPGAEHIHARVGQFQGASQKCRSLSAGIADPAERVRTYVRCMAEELKGHAPIVEAPSPAPEIRPVPPPEVPPVRRLRPGRRTSPISPA